MAMSNNMYDPNTTKRVVLSSDFYYICKTYPKLSYHLIVMMVIIAQTTTIPTDLMRYINLRDRKGKLTISYNYDVTIHYISYFALFFYKCKEYDYIYNRLQALYELLECTDRITFNNLMFDFITNRNLSDGSSNDNYKKYEISEPYTTKNEDQKPSKTYTFSTPSSNTQSRRNSDSSSHSLDISALLNMDTDYLPRKHVPVEKDLSALPFRLAIKTCPDLQKAEIYDIILGTLSSSVTVQSLFESKFGEFDDVITVELFREFIENAVSKPNNDDTNNNLVPKPTDDNMNITIDQVIAYEVDSDDDSNYEA
jgi:hypothetical protein